MSVHHTKRTTLSIATVLILAAMSSAQSRPPLIVHEPDGDITIPTVSGVLGSKDAGALVELSNHFSAVGGIPWTGMQGTGTVTYGPDDPSAYIATLSNLGHDKFRLDATTKQGLMSIRVHGRLGKIQDGDGTLSPMVPETASLLIFPFELCG